MSQAVHPTAQQRSAQTRDNLLAAVERLLAEKDFDQITVQEIAEEAGVAVGTVYRRFATKEAFIPAVVAAYRERLTRAVENPAAFARDNPQAALVLSNEMTLKDALHEMAQLIWRQLAGEPGLMRLVYLTSRSNPQLLDDEWAAIETSQLEHLVLMLDHFGAEIRREDRRQAAMVVLTMMTSGLLDKALFPAGGAAYLSEIDGEKLAAQLAAAAHAYLVTGD